jgi:serine protease
VVGAEVTYTATVTPVPDGGTVAFFEDGEVFAGCDAEPVDANTGRATCQATYGSPDVHKIKARFSGSAGFTASPSRAITQRVVTETPGSPADLKALGGVGNAELSWQSPAWPGTSPVSGYQVTVAPGGTVYDVGGDTTALTVASLNSGTDYRFDVRAVNAAGPGAAATTQLVGTKLSISSKTVTYGSSTTVTGTVSDTGGAALHGKVVVLKARKKGATAWSAVITQPTDELGRYSFTVKPSANYEYRTTYGGDSSYLGAESGIGAVTVRQKVNGQWSDNTVRRGQTAKFYGSVYPNHRDQVIYLQRLIDGTWRNVASTRLTSNSTYTFNRPTYTAGTFKYRTYRPSDADHASGYTPSRTLYVS